MADFESRYQRIYGNVEAAKQDGRLQELEHARFRDSDLSVKGAGLLGFSGLMLACNFVFLSAAPETFLAPVTPWDAVGLAAAFVLIVGAFCALQSILMSAKHDVTASEGIPVSKRFLMSANQFFGRRRSWLRASGGFTVLGTAIYLGAILASVAGQ